MAPKKVGVIKKSQQRLDREKLESASLSAKKTTEVLDEKKEDNTSED